MMFVQNKEAFKKILLMLGMIVCLFLTGCRDKSTKHYRRGLAYYDKREYDKAWENVRKAQALGYEVPPIVLTSFRAAAEGKKVELSEEEHVTVTTTTGTWEVRYGGLYSGLHQFYCNEKAAGEHESKRFSRTEGKVGDLLVFGIETTSFQYSKFNPMQRTGSHTESLIFFRFLLSKVDTKEKIATIIVLPEAE